MGAIREQDLDQTKNVITKLMVASTQHMPEATIEWL